MEIKAKCGHTRKVNLGHRQGRQSRIARIQSLPCPECSVAAKNKRMWDSVCTVTHDDGTPYNEAERQATYEKMGIQ